MLLLLKNLLFTLLVPGTVAVFVPQRIIARAGVAPAADGLILALLGGIATTTGLALYSWCLWDFAVKGRGTPAPIDAPKSLVVSGPYRWVRNPMYVAVLVFIFGQAMIYGARAVALYALAVWAFFCVFVMLYEEPTLRRRFGTDYDAYCSRVGRWLPRAPHY